MTGRDLMTFGKHKGRPLSEVKGEKGYVAWLVEQVWMKEPRYKDLYDYFTEGVSVSATPKEIQNIEIEGELMRNMDAEFKAWWAKAYGEKLRKQGEMVYIPYLRVAIHAWEAALETELLPEEHEALHNDREPEQDEF